ncbi:MAG TPA: signal peptidase I [Bdellovibrionota bacterium]|jgi:signal peptidase I|nr:signal peptidase I [Bdellovibrionota bacterium]
MDRKKVTRELGAFLVMIVTILALRSTVVSHYNVPTGSMIPTILPGDHFLANQMAFGIRIPFSPWFITGPQMPQRGDIIVFPSPVEKGVDLVKRVVALGGDRLEVRGGMLWINGQSMVATPLGPQASSPGIEMYDENLMGVHHRIQLDPAQPFIRDYGPIEIPAGDFFPMGDNRDHSGDGRVFGPVPITELRARAVKILYSVEDFPTFRWDRIWIPFR